MQKAQTIETDYQNSITTDYKKIIFNDGNIYEGEPQVKDKVHRGTFIWSKDSQ